MAQENPPNVNIFNGINYNSNFFIEDNNGLTFEEASSLFLRYPNAQGTENLLTTNINGPLSSSDVININDATLANQNKVCLNLQSSGVPLNRLRVSLNPSAGNLNPIVKSGDVAMCYGTTNPNATSIVIAPVGTTSCGLRMSQNSIVLGSGGTGIDGNNRINITPTAFQLIGGGTNNNISFDNNIIMSNASSGNRNITSTFYNYTSQLDNSTVAVSFMTNGGVLFFDNNFATNGQFGFTTNDGTGVQKSPLIMSAGAFTIGSTNPPTSSATIPVNDNTNALATTAWTQALIASGKTQTVQFTTTTTFNIPTGVIGIGIRMIGKGGIPGTNAAAISPTTSWYSGGTGSGASSISSNGIIGIIGGSSVTLTFDNNVGGGVTFTTNSIVVANVRNGNSGGNATSSSAGVASATQTLGSSNASFGSFTLIAGSGGVAGVGPNLFQASSGVPTIPAGATNSAPLYQPFIDGVRGCGQRYLFTSGANFFQTSTTAPADGVAYLTYYYI